MKIQRQIQKRLKAENSAILQKGPWSILRILWKAPRSWSGHVVHYNKVWKRAILQQGCLCSLSRIPDLIHLTGNGGHQFISIATPLVQGVCGTAHLVFFKPIVNVKITLWKFFSTKINSSTQGSKKEKQYCIGFLLTPSILVQFCY